MTSFSVSGSGRQFSVGEDSRSAVVEANGLSLSVNNNALMSAPNVSQQRPSMQVVYSRQQQQQSGEWESGSFTQISVHPCLWHLYHLGKREKWLSCGLLASIGLLVVLLMTMAGTSSREQETWTLEPSEVRMVEIDPPSSSSSSSWLTKKQVSVEIPATSINNSTYLLSSCPDPRVANFHLSESNILSYHGLNGRGKTVVESYDLNPMMEVDFGVIKLTGRFNVKIFAGISAMKAYADSKDASLLVFNDTASPGSDIHYVLRPTESESYQFVYQGWEDGNIHATASYEIIHLEYDLDDETPLPASACAGGTCTTTIPQSSSSSSSCLVVQSDSYQDAVVTIRTIPKPIYLVASLLPLAIGTILTLVFKQKASLGPQQQQAPTYEMVAT